MILANEKCTWVSKSLYLDGIMAGKGRNLLMQLEIYKKQVRMNIGEIDKRMEIIQ